MPARATPRILRELRAAQTEWAVVQAVLDDEIRQVVQEIHDDPLGDRLAPAEPPNEPQHPAAGPDSAERTAVTVSQDGIANTWDARSGRHIARLEGQVGAFAKLSYSPDGATVVGGMSAGSATVWDVRSGRSLIHFRTGTDEVITAAFSPDGTRVATCGRGERVARVWDVSTGRESATCRGHAEFVVSAEFSPDGTRLLTAAWDNTAALWDPATGVQLAVLRPRDDNAVVGQTNRATFSRDGSRVLVVLGNGGVLVFDAEPYRVRYPEVQELRASIDEHRSLLAQAIAAGDTEQAAGQRLIDACRGSPQRAAGAAAARWELLDAHSGAGARPSR